MFIKLLRPTILKKQRNEQEEIEIMIA